MFRAVRHGTTAGSLRYLEIKVDYGGLILLKLII